ncbi:hypothetical protein L3X38_026563 [Prunus dulcis]|uniref:Mitochondrial protein n=1 Tax=Prunus dulcis TaxID=3755 RepID=A0AAD4VNT2_PRUDU|nr:hypothetical protein L3X38_026563 [Prunus dulcis]
MQALQKKATWELMPLPYGKRTVKCRRIYPVKFKVLKCFLEIEVARSKTSIFLSQRKYMMDLLTETGMLGCKPVDTTIEMNHKLCDDMDRLPTNKEQYQHLI